MEDILIYVSIFVGFSATTYFLATVLYIGTTNICNEIFKLSYEKSHSVSILVVIMFHLILIMILLSFF